MEKILQKTKIEGESYYLVKWKHFEDKYNTWEPYWNLKTYVNWMIEEFEKKNKQTEAENKTKKLLSSGISHKNKYMLKKDALKKPQEQSGKKTSQRVRTSKSNSSKRIKKDSKGHIRKTGNQRKTSAMYGSYETCEPLKIIGHSMLDGCDQGRGRSSITTDDLFLKIEWKERKDLGLKPKPTYSQYSLVKEKSPHLLVEYYEKFVNFIPF